MTRKAASKHPTLFGKPYKARRLLSLLPSWASKRMEARPTWPILKHLATSKVRRWYRLGLHPTLLLLTRRCQVRAHQKTKMRRKRTGSLESKGPRESMKRLSSSGIAQLRALCKHSWQRCLKTSRTSFTSSNLSSPWPKVAYLRSSTQPTPNCIQTYFQSSQATRWKSKG